MNRNSHIEPQQATGPNSTRQSHPSILPGNNNKSGMSGAVGFTGGVGGYPTPIGHQSDLSFVMSLVEDLSQVLQTNQALTAGVVDRMGKIREKAKLSNLKNEDIIAAAATELYPQKRVRISRRKIWSYAVLLKPLKKTERKIGSLQYKVRTFSLTLQRKCIDLKSNMKSIQLFGIEIIESNLPQNVKRTLTSVVK
ncbi:hypothetical protein BGT96224_1785 [Blumeria graminis f. sp. tritici 96224]|uniref:Uncharacterized protein n=1 Tax=Blumeria graminis f. sp. tritici 96224 TaxID=1268274 RepID=A0A656KNQ8_BLUGR|nr:hypothetical protein BGT96224_1785 [Blumeria graminis f. sp. tritici 96224]